MSITPLTVQSKLHGNPTSELLWSQPVKTRAGGTAKVACPVASRAMIALMDMAAVQAASVGAHIEACKLYLTAIEYYQGNDKDVLLQFYESYAYECLKYMEYVIM